MKRKSWLSILIGFLGLVLAFQTGTKAFSQEKLKFAASFKFSPVYYLPIFAAQEKGFWKQSGLDVEYVPFKGAGSMFPAVAAGAVSMGVSSSTSVVQAAARGLPVVIVSDLHPAELYFFWVRGDSRIKGPKDLKGARIGVPRFGGSSHAYARMIVKVLGLKGEVTLVSTGGLRESLALLKKGATEVGVHAIFPLMELKLKGEIREVVSINDYLPKPWMASIIFARKELVRDKPNTGKRAVKGILRATDFLRQNAAWARDRLKSESRYSEKAAQLVYGHLRANYTRDGKINRKALENVRNFLLEYRIVDKEKLPSADKLFTDKLLP